MGNKSPQPRDLFVRSTYSRAHKSAGRLQGQLQAVLVRQAHHKAQGWTRCVPARLMPRPWQKGRTTRGPRRGSRGIQGPAAQAHWLPSWNTCSLRARVPETGKRVPDTAAQRQVTDLGNSSSTSRVYDATTCQESRVRTPVRGG